ncbi:MAG: hypothetical protein K2X91_11770, partial [Thermoleophilia bacterium]|nr:hypothetical protein [Thermoleophilia bacterium]
MALPDFADGVSPADGGADDVEGSVRGEDAEAAGAGDGDRPPTEAPKPEGDEGGGLGPDDPPPDDGLPPFGGRA